ncbi:hypothetical protein, partial [Oharaeibacter diazotrophicus]
MAKNTTVKDPAEAALSAVEEALKIDFGNLDPAPGSTDADLFGDTPAPAPEPAKPAAAAAPAAAPEPAPEPA